MIAATHDSIGTAPKDGFKPENVPPNGLTYRERVNLREGLLAMSSSRGETPEQQIAWAERLERWVLFRDAPVSASTLDREPCSQGSAPSGGLTLPD